MSSRPSSGSMDLRVQRTYKLLKEALVRLLEKKPFDQITVQEICEEAMVRRTTFYQHFEDKHDFLNWFIHDKQQEFMARSAPDVSFQELNLKDYCASIVRKMLKYLSENRQVVDVLLHSGVQGRSLQDAFSRSCVEELTQIIDRYAHEKGLAPSVPTAFLAEFYVGGIISAARWWFVDGTRYSEEEMVRCIRVVSDIHFEEEKNT